MSNNSEKATRPASADYPVNPAERSSQEARLRKAAAAGASASKSPLPALMLQRPAPLPVAQAVPEPQASLSKPTGSAQSIPESSDGRSAPRITNDEVLAELRKISAWADLQRKINKWALIFLAGFVPALIGIFMLMDRHLNTPVDSSPSPHPADWYDVDHSIRQGDFEKAIAIGEELILKTPQYPEAHERLARAYLAAGNLEKAREHYAEAFRLLPSEENERLLGAIEKRIRTDKP